MGVSCVFQLWDVGVDECVCVCVSGGEYVGGCCACTFLVHASAPLLKSKISKRIDTLGEKSLPGLLYIEICEVILKLAPTDSPPCAGPRVYEWRQCEGGTVTQSRHGQVTSHPHQACAGHCQRVRVCVCMCVYCFVSVYVCVSVAVCRVGWVHSPQTRGKAKL
jgi:hypothetical protein